MGWETYNLTRILSKEQIEFLKEYKKKNGITIDLQIRKAIERHIALSRLPKERAEFLNRLEEFLLYPTYSHSKPITIPEIMTIRQPKIPTSISVSKKTLSGKILHYLCKCEHKTATRYELAEKLNVQPSMISRAVNNLIYTGLVNRTMERITHIGRSFYVYEITAKGIYEAQKEN